MTNTETYEVTCPECGKVHRLNRKQATVRQFMCWNQESSTCRIGSFFKFPYPLPCEPTIHWMGGTWLPLCPCGWRGRLHSDRSGDNAAARAAAQAEANTHRAAA